LIFNLSSQTSSEHFNQKRYPDKEPNRTPTNRPLRNGGPDRTRTCDPALIKRML